MTYRDSQIIEGKSRWPAVAVAALVINLMLLSVLPVVNLGRLSLPKNPPPLQAIKFVRLTPPDTVLTKTPDTPQEVLPRPEIPAPVRETFDLTPDSLERTFQPDLQRVPVPTDMSALADIPLAAVDFAAMNLGDVFDADDLDKPLIPVSRVPPFYPLQAKRASVEGWVDIEFMVNEQGRVTDIRIIDAQPPGVFEQSVRKAVSGWRFQPGTVMGEPVKTRVATTIRFELEGDS